MAASQSTTLSAALPSTPVDVRSIPLALIDRVRNPREDFDREKLQGLADSIRAVGGLLEPIICRPTGERFELVAGERRLRAVELLGWPEITASVRELDDRQAAEVRLLENLDRVDLNPLEEAGGFRELQELGHTPESIGFLVRRTAEAIGSRIALLSLPKEWSDRVRSGTLSATAAEYLTPWAKYPRVLEAMRGIANRFAERPGTLTEWSQSLNSCVMNQSRSMDPECPTGPIFTPTPEESEQLEIVEIQLHPTVRVRRAMQTALWDALQDRAEMEAESATASPPPGSHGNGAKPRPATASRPSGGKPAQDVAGKPGSASNCDTPGGEYLKRLRAYKASYIRQLIQEKLPKTGLSALMDVAERMEIDLRKSWILTREFLALHDAEQLERLASEWGIDISICQNENELIAILLHAGPAEPPQALMSLDESAN